MNNLNNLDVISQIKKDKLDSISYFQTIIEEGYKVKLLTDEDMVNIQIQLLELLDKVVYKYNGVDSSSIRKEVLEDISISNIYTLGIYLKTFTNPDNAIKELKEKGLIYIYEQGKKRIYKMLDIIRISYVKVKQTKLNIFNDIYNDTIIGGIKGFLKIYDADFKAQDMKITADYPLYNQLIGKLEGVEFIKEYLNSIYLENIFCKYFPEQNIKELLYSYSEDYEELVINIFEIVLYEVIACQLVNRELQDLIISSHELDEIYHKFDNKDDNEINEILQKAYNSIKDKLFYDDIQLQEYIEKNFENIKKVILLAYKYRKLDDIFITQKFINN